MPSTPDKTVDYRVGQAITLQDQLQQDPIFGVVVGIYTHKGVYGSYLEVDKYYKIQGASFDIVRVYPNMEKGRYEIAKTS